jgi:hypothetical protein
MENADGHRHSRSSGLPVIGRIWRGTTREEDARAYRDSLRADLREVRSVDVNVGAFILAHRGDAKRSSCFVPFGNRWTLCSGSRDRTSIEAEGCICSDQGGLTSGFPSKLVQSGTEHEDELGRPRDPVGFPDTAPQPGDY